MILIGRNRSFYYKKNRFSNSNRFFRGYKGGKSFVLDPNHEYCVICRIVLAGKNIELSQRILRKKNIDTRQQACNKFSCPSLMSTDHTRNRLNNSTEKRDQTQTICSVYQKLIESEGWGISKSNRKTSNNCLPQGRREEKIWVVA